MKKAKFYMVSEQEGATEFLKLHHEAKGFWRKRPARKEDITLEAIAQMLDEDAENINAHDFVCAHRGLAVILFRMLGREKATEVFIRLADFRGLHGLVDCGGCVNLRAHEKELGVSLHDWSKWQIK